MDCRDVSARQGVLCAAAHNDLVGARGAPPARLGRSEEPLRRTAFSTQFAANAFNLISPVSVIFVVFVNLFLYFFFTGLCLLLARPPCLGRPADAHDKPTARAHPFSRRLLGAMTFGKREGKRPSCIWAESSAHG